MQAYITTHIVQIISVAILLFAVAYSLFFIINQRKLGKMVSKDSVSIETPAASKESKVEEAIKVMEGSRFEEKLTKNAKKEPNRFGRWKFTLGKSKGKKVVATVTKMGFLHPLVAKTPEAVSYHEVR